jgi:V8-like Glu-specific endopeptidase
MATTEQNQSLKALKEMMAKGEAEGTPLFVPDLKALGLIVGNGLEAGAEAIAPPAPYEEVLESICGVVDDSQEVEQYDGTLGVAAAFVAAHQSAACQVQWNGNLGAIFNNAGNVSGIRWGSGTMIADDIFLTCGHLFDDDANGWMLPVDNATGTIITPAQKALNMHLNFNFQEDPMGNMRPEQSFPITELMEYRLGGIDMAVCRIGGNPGGIFGRTRVSLDDVALNDMICIIGHPAGLPKRIEAGPATALNGDAIRYNDIDTLGGNSGSGVLHANSDSVVGVHTNGGCNAAGTGSNSGVRITSILRESPTVRNIAHAGRWVARHGLSSGDYQGAFDQFVGLGYRLLTVNAAGGNDATYSAIFEHRPGPAFVARHGITSQQYQAEFDNLVPQGFRPTAVSGAGVGGQVLYAAIFEQVGGGAFVARHGINGQQYQAVFDELVPQGFRPKFVNGATVGNDIVYATVFEQDGGPAFIARHGMTSGQYQAAFDNAVGQGFRPVWVSGTGVGGEVIYAAIFEQRPGPAFVARHGLTSADYQATFDQLLGQGFRPVVVSGANAGGQLLYAAIWEQR